MSHKYENYNKYLKSKFYTGSKREYLQFSRYFERNYKKHLPRNKNARILDIGCGLGHFLYFLRRNGYTRAVGIDMDNENVKNCIHLGFSDIKVIDAFKYLQAIEDRFDVIVMNDVIEHIPQDKVIKLLKMCRDALDKNGVLLIKTVNCNNLYGISSFFSDFTHEVAYTKEKMIQVGIMAGFKGIDVHNLFLCMGISIIDYSNFIFSYFLYKFRSFQFFFNGRKKNDVHSKNLLAVLKK